MMKKFIIYIIVLALSSISSNNAKTVGQILDEKFQDVQSNISRITDLENREEQIVNDINALKMIHGYCAPCLHRTTGYCDCRNLEPKQDCLEFYQAGIRVDGLYKILSSSTFTSSDVFCDQTSMDGGWTVFQRRKDGSENFYRGWSDYKIGFGKLESEFWFGNDNIHDLTKSSNHPKDSTLLINMVKKGDVTPLYAMYNAFTVGNETGKYVLHLSGFSGNTTDRLSYHNNMKFSTFDQDNDRSGGSCASTYKGAWWYNGCHFSNLNGLYKFTGSTSELIWEYGSKTIQPTFVEMKVRRNI